MNGTIWNIPVHNSSADRELAQTCGIGVLTARILRSRGITTVAAVADYFAADTSPLSDPYGLTDMEKAVRRLRMAVAEKECVAVIGDYDADGVTSVYILTDYLESLGLRCLAHIPDRATEGYGVSVAAVQRLAREGATLMITVDTGITAFEPAKYAAELGVDLIITDHHTCLDRLPDALAVVDPWRSDSPEVYRGLAGVGVAFKLISALHGNGEQLLAHYADVICVGTVADVMPLIGENRRIVMEGLDKLSHAPNLGLAALLQCAGNSDAVCTTQTVAFRLAPRINAPGRMSSALASLNLLRAQTETEARFAAEELCRQNTARQTVEQGIRAEAEKILEQTGFDPVRDGAIFLANPNWHTGVLGIVCARLSEKYNCPAILATQDGAFLKASARSVRGIHLHETLSALSEYIVQFGGHELAAGLTLLPEQADAFAQAFRDHVSAQRRAGGFTPTVNADCEVSLPELTVPEVRCISRLAPFGEGNPEPLLVVRGVSVSEVIGLKEGRHTRLTVTDHGNALTALFFGRSPDEVGLSCGDRADLLFHVQLNYFRGNCSVNLLLRDVRLHRDADVDKFAAFCDGSTLSAADAERLIPDRSEFAIAWRALVDAGADGLAKTCLSDAKCAVVTRVFCEAGLVQTEGDTMKVCIPAKKADLSVTPTMQALTSAAQGKLRG